MKTSISMNLKTQQVMLELLPAIQAIFTLGFIPSLTEIVEFEEWMYERFFAESEEPLERPLYHIKTDNPNFQGTGIMVLSKEHVGFLKQGIDFFARYAKDHRLPSHDQEAILQYAAQDFPAEMSKGTCFEQPLLKIVGRQEKTETKRQSLTGFLNRFLGKNDVINLTIKDEKGIQRDEIIAPAIEANFQGEKMDYPRFKAHAVKHLQNVFGAENIVENVSAETDETAHEVIHFKTKTGRLETFNGFRISPFYKDYSLGKPLEELLDEMEAAIKKNNDFAKHEIFDHLTDFEKSKDRIIIRPIHYKSNEKLLKDYIYRRYNDIALVIYVVIKQKGSDLSTVKISKGIAGHWNMSEAEIFDWAIANTEARYKACILPMEAAMSGKTLETYPAKHKYLMDHGFVLEKSELGTYNLFLEGNVNAATAVFYNGALKKLASHIGDDLYLVIASMSFVVIHEKRSISLNRVRKFAKQEKSNPYANPSEFLSDGVYFYNRKEDSLRLMYQ